MTQFYEAKTFIYYVFGLGGVHEDHDKFRIIFILQERMAIGQCLKGQTEALPPGTMSNLFPYSP